MAGSLMENISSRFDSSLMVNSDRSAGSSVSHSASAAAIFMGWVLNMC